MDRFETDRASGSTSVGAGFLGALERFAEQDRSRSLAELRVALFGFLREAQAAQPSMALVHQLAARALAIAETSVARGEEPADLRSHLLQSCAAEREDLQSAITQAAKTAAALIVERDGWIATLSASGIVRAALLELKRGGRRPRVLLAESRPGLEGRAMAASLAADGIPVWLVADAALPMLLSNASALWIGADAVNEQGVLNKIGSFTLALAAREHGVPVHALAIRRKFLPSNTPALSIVEMPSAEIWDSPPEGVKPRNVYFEMTPHALLRGVVVEDGVLGVTEAALTAQDRALPEALAAALPEQGA